MSHRFSFTIHATDGRARLGTIAMQRGEIRTPAFMPVGTAATVKAVKPEGVRAAGADIILGNTYHLMLRPGAERVARLGGLHAFMGWERPILTDSGGYQVMSLSDLNKVTEEGVTFKSHLDGSRHLLSPERSIEVQRLLGSDIVMQFDELVRPDVRPRQAARGDGALDPLGAPQPRGVRPRRGACRGRWRCSESSRACSTKSCGAESADALIDIGFDGYAVGGLAVGEGQEAMLGCLDFAPGQLPDDKPRYLMGVGKPDDIVEAVTRGIDMFDCVLPTRSGRTGQAFTADGPINIRNAAHRRGQASRSNPAARAPPARRYSRAYLHHLVRSGEILGAMLMTEHNLWFYQRLMQGLREAIGEGRLAAHARDFLTPLPAERPCRAGLTRPIRLPALWRRWGRSGACRRRRDSGSARSCWWGASAGWC